MITELRDKLTDWRYEIIKKEEWLEIKQNEMEYKVWKDFRKMFLNSKIWKDKWIIKNWKTDENWKRNP